MLFHPCITRPIKVSTATSVESWRHDKFTRTRAAASPGSRASVHRHWGTDFYAGAWATIGAANRVVVSMAYVRPPNRQQTGPGTPMSSRPEPSDSERCGTEYVAVLAQTWAAVEPREQLIDQGYAGARTIEELVNDFLLANDPFPVGTAVFAARWQPGRWGLAQVVSRDGMDEWAVVFIDGSGKVMRDHVELCPAF